MTTPPGAFDGRLDGRRAVVTGAGCGYGAAVARRFGVAGARVVVADADAAAAEAVAVTIPGAVPVHADLRRPADAPRLVETAVDELGGIDVLVNGVHTVPAPGPALELSIEDFDEHIVGNVRTAFLGVKYAVSHMGPGSVIVNLATTAARRPGPLPAAYTASVGSLITLTRGLAAELGPRIRVNAVCWSAIEAAGPLGRAVTDDDVAGAVLFLAAARSSFLTGVCLEVTGGRDIE